LDKNIKQGLTVWVCVFFCFNFVYLSFCFFLFEFVFCLFEFVFCFVCLNLFFLFEFVFSFFRCLCFICLSLCFVCLDLCFFCLDLCFFCLDLCFFCLDLCLLLSIRVSCFCQWVSHIQIELYRLNPLIKSLLNSLDVLQYSASRKKKYNLESIEYRKPETPSVNS